MAGQRIDLSEMVSKNISQNEDQSNRISVVDGNFKEADLLVASRRQKLLVRRNC